MAKINNVKLKTLKQTKNFYLWELKRKESLTESERSKYLLALKSIKKIIQEKEKSGEKEKNKNPFLKPGGGFDLIEKFPGIDYMPYEKKKIKKSKTKR